jgi:hypothetical protein
MESKFTGGSNIALKIPKHKYEETVRFYREILKLEVTEKPIDHPTISRTHQVVFGSNILWLDCVNNYAHAEVWLELRTPDVASAATYLAEEGVSTCDEIEQIPEGTHWIMDPAGTVFILDKPAAPNQ